MERMEYYADAPELQRFIHEVRAAMATGVDPDALMDQLKPAFARLLAADGWLPEQYARPYEASGMGGGIGQYLLYRSVDPTITLFSLVVPADASTPVHDHLAWGLVGLYRGQQREEVYALEGGDPDQGEAVLRLAEENDLRPGDFYALIPPDGDIHRVTTISPEASISIHLLGNDAGCVVRHQYDPAQSTATSFQSGYSNAGCVSEQEPAG